MATDISESKVVLWGFWRYLGASVDQSRHEDPIHAALPWPVPENVSPDYLHDVLSVMKAAEEYPMTNVARYRGSSTCRLCGCQNGSAEYRLVVGDKWVVWPEGARHYIEQHSVLPDPKFLGLLRKHIPR